MCIKILLVAATLLAASAPAVADDLIYHTKSSDDPDILTTFDGQPYWKPLARCAGIYTTIAAHLRNNGKEDLAKAVEDERTIFMNGYAHRIADDRGLSVTDAIAVAHDEFANSAGMMEDAMVQDSGAQGEMLTQCEKAFNLIQQYTSGQ